MSNEIFDFNEELNLTKDQIVSILGEMKGEFESINRLASLICDTPISLVNILDNNFQYTISKYGDWPYDSVSPKQFTTCQYTVLNDEVLIINDTHTDERTKAVQQLVEDQSVRFYAGMPIKSPSGINLGALCVLDFEPRELTEEQLQALNDLAREIEYRIKLYMQKKKTDLSNNKLRKAAAFLDNSTDVLLTVDPNDFTILESIGANSVLSTPDNKLVGNRLFTLIDEVNVQHRLKDWMKQKNIKKRLGIPVKIKVDPENVKWLLLSFSKYENELLVTVKEDITKEHLAEERLKKSLEEKEVLLSETHHRVKNNLAIIYSLLMLERLKCDNELIQHVFLNSENRIITISKIHELLCRTNNFSKVELSEYITDLLEYIESTYDLNRNMIELKTEISNIAINANQALPVGLIINELVTNSIKHAFNGKESGKIQVVVLKKDNGAIQFEVSDNGNGAGISLSGLQEEGNMGFTLVNTLKEQLEADLNLHTENGTRFRFQFKENGNKGSVNNM